MKKIFVFLLAACLLAGVMTLAAPEVKAADHSQHCYCINAEQVPADHVCEQDASWEAINSGSGNAIAVVDNGHYYLQIDKPVSITVKDGMTATLCLNGHTMRAGCPVTVFGGGVLNICDCQGSGKIISTQRTKGTVMLISSSPAYVGTVNLYSGTVSGATNNNTFCRVAEVKGGVFYMYGGTLTDGSDDPTNANDTKPGYGGNVCVYNNEGNTAQFHMYGGTITGGSATVAGGNIYVESGICTLQGGTVTGGMAGGLPETVLLGEGNGLIGCYTDMAAALAQWKSGQFVRLLEDCQETVSLPDGLYLDMNGHDLSGVSVSGKLYGFDSATDSYTGNNAGSLRCQLSGGQVLALDQQPDGRYLAIEDNGAYSFHRFYVSITHLSVKPAHAGMGYRAAFYGDDVVSGLVSSFGYEMWMDGYGVCTYDRSDLALGRDLTLRLQNIFSADNTTAQNLANAEKQVHARPFLKLCSGEKLTGQQLSYDFKEMLHLVEDSYSGYTSAQKNALQDLSAKYSEEMMTWDVPNLHHAAGGMWTAVDEAGFLALLKKGTTKYTVTSGNYVLTENVDLEDRQIYLNSTVKLCLNGYTISGTKDLFELPVTGDLTICDCHDAGAEGGITSSLAGDGAAPVADVQGGMLTLYGGALSATGQVSGAGVVAVTNDSDKTGTVTMYGGSISGGSTTKQGGLVTVANGSDFCMYGGRLHHGTAKGNGGAVYADTGAVVKLLGGQIDNCTAGANGGAVILIGAESCHIGEMLIHDNTAAGYGGAIAVRDHTPVYVDGAQIYNCQAGSWGGGIYLTLGAQCHMTDSLIYGNTAENGGGIAARTDTILQMTGGKLYDCSANVSGGGIWVLDADQCHLEGAELSGNTAVTYGGNLYNDSCADLRLHDACAVSGEAADGSGVYIHRGQLATSGTTRIEDNTNDDLQLNFYGSLNADGLTQGAQVLLSAYAHGKIGTDANVEKYVVCQDSGYEIKRLFDYVVVWNESYPEIKDTQGFNVGYGKVCITPAELGVPLGGYGNPESRLSQNNLSDIYATAVAITDEDGQTVLLFAVDLSGVSDTLLNLTLPTVSQLTNVPQENIFITASHTHSAPSITTDHPTIQRYKTTLPDLMAQCAVEAMADRAPATMETGSLEVEGLNFVRHYTYQDADSVWQYFCDNFGEPVFNDTTKHVTQADNTMHLVKFTRDSGNILMANWRGHPTLTGGMNEYDLSADYVGALRDAIKEKTGMDMIYFQGASGNINVKSRLPAEKYPSGYTYEDHADDLSDQILAALEGGCLNGAPTGNLQVDHYDYTATVDKDATQEEYEAAKAFVEVYYDTITNDSTFQEKWDLCAQYGYTCVFEASAIVRRYEKDDTEQLPLNAVSVGKSFGIYTAPGELWDRVGMEMEEASPFDMTFCLGYCQGAAGYFVYDPAYAPASGQLHYESYEGFNRNYVNTTINDMIAYWKETLSRLYANAE